MTYETIIDTILETLKKKAEELSIEAKEADEQLHIAENKAWILDSTVSEIESAIKSISRLKDW